MLEPPFSSSPVMLRMSRVLHHLRANNDEYMAKKLEQFHKEFGDRCKTHGALEDPIVGIVDKRVAFFCPFCSGSAVREQWEAEGPS